MSDIKATPRQKLIGMMYLVLTALLALNVSKEILNAFVLVNEGLEMTTGNFDVKNEMLYSDFDQAKSFDAEKVLPYWQKAQQAKELSAELDAAIQELKIMLIAKTEGIPIEVADTIGLHIIDKKDNYDTPTNIMIGDKEDGAGAKAEELRRKITTYKEQLLALLDKDDAENIDLGLATNPVKTEDGELNWEVGNFYHTPLAATVTLLSKLQTEVKNAEFDVVNTLYKKFDKDDFKFDTIAAKVISPSNYILLGDSYAADIFVAAFSTTQNPEVLINQKEESPWTVPVDAGMGRYKVQANSEGFHEYGGTIKMKTPAGEVKEYPFKSEYIVARPSLTVAPTKMNVLYKGIDNPISVSVPGVPLENITATITGGNTLQKTGNGKYIAKMKGNSPYNVKVMVSAKMPNGESRNMGSMDFRAKPLPKPYAKVGEISTSGRMKKNVLKLMRVKGEYDPNFEFALSCRVKSFNISTRYQGRPVDEPVLGNKMSTTAQKIIERVPTNTTIVLNEIKAVGDDRKTHELSPVTITVY